MDSINMETEMEGTLDNLTGLSSSPSSSDGGDIFGYPQVTPRVGHEYQAEIPPLIGENDSLQLIQRQILACLGTKVSESFLLGLPIPVMWTNDEVENINGTVEFENGKESHISSSNEHATVKAEPLGAVLNDGKETEQLSNRESAVGVDKMDIGSGMSRESKTKLNQAEKCCPLPGSLGESLTDIECDGFLLGLYIFGKNLMWVKRFVENKQMGDVLSFYYGKFYKSAEYRRWSECRKMRSRRRIHGQKIFTGWRQQELISRLSFRVSQENQNLLIEVSRKFEDGRVPFEDYVFALKGMVGISTLIKVVGIGRGKKDLTGNTMEAAKPNPIFPTRSEIPRGKAWSSLTLGDVIKFLTGDFRLSKARSNDLFWEAVWPRLLARGWHSEQPKDHGISSLKHALVFLIPGVKKFSRRKLVKGDQYFDSVSDVLNKVASDPGLLELETEAANGGEHKEDQTWDDAAMEQDSNSLLKQRNHCCLQPRNPSSSQNLMKFTVIDTSLVSGKGRPKVRELRSLPDGIDISTPSSLSSESEQDTSEESKNEAEETNGSKSAEDVTDGGTCADSSDCVTSIQSNGLIYVPDTTMETHDSQSTSLPNEKQPVEIMNHQVKRKLKSGQANHRALVRKCQNSTACCNGESSRSTELISTVSKLNEGDSRCRSNSPDVCEDMLYLVGNGRSQNLSSASSLAKGSPERSNEGGIITKNHLQRQCSPEKHQHRTLIDLNLPQVSFTVQDDSSGEKSSSLPGTVCQIKPLELHGGGDSTTEQDSTMNSRRQSTRNRPLTTKALEALQWGFFHTNKKRKDAEAPENSERPSRRPRRKTKVVDLTSVNGISSNMSDTKEEEENSNGVIGSNSFLDVNSHI